MALRVRLGRRVLLVLPVAMAALVATPRSVRPFACLRVAVVAVWAVRFLRFPVVVAVVAERSAVVASAQPLAALVAIRSPLRAARTADQSVVLARTESLTTRQRALPSTAALAAVEARMPPLPAPAAAPSVAAVVVGRVVVTPLRRQSPAHRPEVRPTPSPTVVAARLVQVARHPQQAQQAQQAILVAQVRVVVVVVRRSRQRPMAQRVAQAARTVAAVVAVAWV